MIYLLMNDEQKRDFLIKKIKKTPVSHSISENGIKEDFIDFIYKDFSIKFNKNILKIESNKKFSDNIFNDIANAFLIQNNKNQNIIKHYTGKDFSITSYPVKNNKIPTILT